MTFRSAGVLIAALLVSGLLVACGGTTSSNSTTNIQGDYVALLSDGHTRVALSTDGTKMVAYASDGDDSHSPTFSQWFRGSVTDDSVDLNALNGDQLKASLTSQSATGALALEDGTTRDFTAYPLTSDEEETGSGLYRGQATSDEVSYLAGWIGDKSETGGTPTTGGAIRNEQTQELLAAPQLTDEDISDKQVSVSDLDTFTLTKCQQEACA